MHLKKKFQDFPRFLCTFESCGQLDVNVLADLMLKKRGMAHEAKVNQEEIKDEQGTENDNFNLLFVRRRLWTMDCPRKNKSDEGAK